MSRHFCAALADGRAVVAYVRFSRRADGTFPLRLDFLRMIYRRTEERTAGRWPVYQLLGPVAPATP